MKKSLPTVKTVMTTFPYKIGIDEKIDTANALMYEHQIRHLPVVEKGKLVGVISDRDIQLALSLLNQMDEDKLLVRHICTQEPYTVGLNTPVADVALEMAKRHIGSAIVMHDEKISGIFTTTDACRTLGELLRSEYLPPEVG